MNVRFLSPAVAVALLLVMSGCADSSKPASSVEPSPTTTVAPRPVPVRATRQVSTRPEENVLSFGHAAFLGSTARKALGASVVGMAQTADGRGYWLVARDGGVFSFGAPFYGSLAGRHLAQPIVGIAATPSGRGYWLAAADGGVFRFGDARFYGSLAGRRVHAPVTAIVAGADGYWLLAGDGGVFRFGAARFYGSVVGKPVNEPVVGMAATRTGHGYWLVARDGGVFAFGDARFSGSASAKHLNAPATGIVGAGDGYLLVTADGGVFTFGGAHFFGSAAGQVASSQRVVQLVGTPKGDGYRMLVVDAPPPQIPAGGITAIGDSVMIDAAPALTATIPGISVDATTSRAPANGISLLQSLAATGRLGASIVWGLGTNGTFTVAELDQVLQIAAGRHVVVVTEHCGYCSWTPVNNAMIHAHCVESRHCTIADFDALANANPGWFGSDTVHMAIGGTGAQAYAQLVHARLSITSGL